MGKHGFGSIRRSRGNWQIRYYVDEIGKDGKPFRRQIAKVLAPYGDQYRTERDVQPLADRILVPLRRQASVSEAALTISEFADRYFLIWVKSKRKASTHRFYKYSVDTYLRDSVGAVRLRDFTTRHAQDVLDRFTISHQSLLRIKTTMSAIFSYAIRLGFINGVNPVRESKAEGSRNNPQRYAYSVQEIAHILGKLSGQAKVAVGIAAFSGLRESEIRGLQWPDYDGQLIHVRRAIWRTYVDETKTPESANAVPVIAPLKKLLDAHKASNGSGRWILSGEKKGFSTNLDNLCKRVIKPAIGSNLWHGWHAFRRGLMTNLYELGVPPEVAQTILRHADASTSRKHYLVLESQKQGRAAMRKLEKSLAIKERKRSKRTPRNRRKPHKH